MTVTEWIIVGGIATLRLAVMVSKEKGPGGVFLRLRESRWLHPNVREGLSCPRCVGVWVALWVAWVIFFGSFWWSALVIALAISGVAVLLGAALERLMGP